MQVTALPSFDRVGESRQLPVDDHDVIPPKDLFSSIDNISGSLSTEKMLRAKRFFRYSVKSVTVTSYSLLSTTVTKTVAIGAAGAVSCLPSGWIAC